MANLTELTLKDMNLIYEKWKDATTELYLEKQLMETNRNLAQLKATLGTVLTWS